MDNQEVKYTLHLGGIDQVENGFKSIKHHADILHEGMTELKTVFAELFAIEKIFEFGKEAFNAFTEASVASAQLDATLKSTNDAVGMTREQLDELSESLSKHSLNTKTAETAMQSVLTTFTAIHKDVFPQAQQAVNDMSAKLGGGLSENAIRLGKALQDPVHGITALHRAGVNFSEGQKNVIKQLVATGHVAEAQRLILKELQTEFGGSAQAAADSNPLQFLKNQAEEIMVKIGGVISKLFVELRPIIDFALKIVEKVVEVFGSLGIERLVKPLIKALNMVIGLVKEFIAPFEEVLAPIMDYIVDLVNEIVDAFSQLMPILKPIIHILAEMVVVFIKIALFIDRTILRFIQWLTHTQIFKAVWDSIVLVIERVVGFIERIVGGIKTLLHIKDEKKSTTNPREKITEEGVGNYNGKNGSLADDLKPGSQSSAVTGTKQVIINVSINKVVENVKIMAATVEKSKERLTAHVADALLSAVNQFSASADL